MIRLKLERLTTMSEKQNKTYGKIIDVPVDKIEAVRRLLKRKRLGRNQKATVKVRVPLDRLDEVKKLIESE